MRDLAVAKYNVRTTFQGHDIIRH